MEQVYGAGVPAAEQRFRQAPLRAAFRRAWPPMDDTGNSRPARMFVGLFDAGDWPGWLPEAMLLLDGSERARAARLRDRSLRDLRVRAYALHRLFLGQLLGMDPTRVPLYRDRLGCPRVADDMVWTSLSHAGQAIAVAVSTDGPVGIDIEPTRRHHAMAEIAGRVCHPDELARLARQPHRDTGADLLELWVAKEALLKAAGIGLEVEMDRFAVDAAWECESLGRARHLPVRLLEAGDEWVAAVAGTPGAGLAGGWIHPLGNRQQARSKLVAWKWKRPEEEASRVRIKEPLSRVNG